MEGRNDKTWVRGIVYRLRSSFLMATHSPSGSQQLSIPEDVLTNIQKNLYSLRDFLNQNLHLFHIAPGEPASARPAAGNEQEAWKVDLFSTSHCVLLIIFI